MKHSICILFEPMHSSYNQSSWDERSFSKLCRVCNVIISLRQREIKHLLSTCCQTSTREITKDKKRSHIHTISDVKSHAERYWFVFSLFYLPVMGGTSSGAYVFFLTWSSTTTHEQKFSMIQWFLLAYLTKNEFFSPKALFKPTACDIERKKHVLQENRI